MRIGTLSFLPHAWGGRDGIALGSGSPVTVLPCAVRRGTTCGMLLRDNLKEKCHGPQGY
jgi:hypothetical protein